MSKRTKNKARPRAKGTASHTEILEIRDIDSSGDGIAFFDGQPVFISGALPQETYRTTFEGQKGGGYTTIKAAREGKESPLRQTPTCRHAEQCGGCALQHLKPEAYRKTKQDIAQQHLSALDLNHTDILPPFFSAPATRRRAELTLKMTQNGLLLGYHRRKSHDIIDIKECPLLTKRLEATALSIKAYFEQFMKPRETLDIFLQDTDSGVDCVITGSLPERYERHDALGRLLQETEIISITHREKPHAKLEQLLRQKTTKHSFGSLHVTLSPAAFMQASEDGERAIIDTARSLIPNQALKICDLFCGYGTLSAALNLSRAHYTGFESDLSAVSALQKASHEATSVHHRNLFKEPLSAEELDQFDLVMLDPPRAGAKEQCVQLAQTQSLSHSLYISCNPKSFARDAHLLMNAGWTLSALRLIDQFLWSPHMELVASFHRSR